MQFPHLRLCRLSDPSEEEARHCPGGSFLSCRYDNHRRGALNEDPQTFPLSTAPPCPADVIMKSIL